MNQDLLKLQPYPFERLAALKSGIEPPADKQHIALSIGEPKHPTPGFITEELITHLHGLSSYPLTRGSEALRSAIADWLINRFGLPETSLGAENNILPVNGTREALFAIAQAVTDRSSKSLILMPNPFYQIYEGAAFLAGAEPWFLNTLASNNYLPDFDDVPDSVWQQCQLVYICTPGNPTGAVMDISALQTLIVLSDKYNFIIASDECYSELYIDESSPPPGLLQAAAEMNRTDYKNCLVFHSLSKRSNAPGLRSGFVAGDSNVIGNFLTYRTYHGCAMSPPIQAASRVAWQDEAHVESNRQLYREKFQRVLEVLAPVMSVHQPEAGFYLWPETPISDTEFAQQLYARENVTVLPGSFLSRDAHGLNPGAGHIRMALVADEDECVEAALRIRSLIEQL